MQLIPVLFGITFLSFAMMRAAGSDAVMELYGDKGAVAQEIIDARRTELGLDQPFFTQYLAWLRGILTGDMGISYVSGKKGFDTFVSKLPATLLLTALSMGATVVLSIPLGVLAAVRHDKFTDYFLRFFMGGLQQQFCFEGQEILFVGPDIFLHLGRSVRPGEGVGILGFGQQHHAHVHPLPEDHVDPAQRSVDTRRVSVVNDRDVFRKTVQQAYLLGRERCPGRRNDVLDTRLVHR